LNDERQNDGQSSTIDAPLSMQLITEDAL